MEYDDLLARAYKKLPDNLKEHERFEMPQVLALIQGKQTVLQNLGEVSKGINRDPDQVSKYLIREFGTSGTHDVQHLVMKGQFRQQHVQEKFEHYVEEFVLCSECGRPDTKTMRDGRINFLKCEACGSRHPLGSVRRTTPTEISKEPEIGEEITVDITKTGRRGDGMAKMGNYLVFVSGAKVGQKAKARITGVQGTMVFATATQIL